VTRFKAALVLDLVTAQTTWTADIGVLVLAAAIIERANEVIVMAFRDYEADRLEDLMEQANDAFAANTIEPLREIAAQAKTNLTEYKAQTKEFALLVALCFGLMVSLAGVRSLHPLLSNQGFPAGRLFTIVDIILTGAMLAGGSEGVHRLANIVSSGADTLSTRIDNAAK
jgi:hypothetical protein